MRLFICTVLMILGNTLLPVAAQSSAYVSVTGSDANSCTASLPCRQVTRALEANGGGGTVHIISSGDYEKFQITSSAGIIAASGVTATITSNAQYGGSAVSIQNFTTKITVRLSGLTIRASGTGASGIATGSSFNSLQIDNCSIGGGEWGLRATSPGLVSIVNSRFTSAVRPIEIASSDESTDALIENTHFHGPGGILMVGVNARVTIRNSSISHAGGILASGIGARLMLENCVINNSNSDGVYITEYAYVRLSNSTITNSDGYGVRNSGGNVKTYGNNRLFNNKLGDVSGTVGVLSQF